MKKYMKTTACRGSVVLFLLCVIMGCEKFLDDKPNQKLAIPKSLADFQAILDDSNIMYNAPAAAEISTDDYYLSDNDWNGLFYINNKRMYTWEKDNLFSTAEPENDWLLVYRMVFRCNIVLEGLSSLDRAKNDEAQWRNISGQAYYYRGNFMMHGAFIWAPAYDAGTTNSDLGLPIRLGTDFNEASKRASVGQTYDQIILDLKKAASLLPVTPLSKFRPSKPAAYGLLARVYLSMRDYANAKLFADSSLQLYDKLMDYNLLNPNANFPVLLNNEEVIVNQNLLGRDPLSPQLAKIRMDIYDSYKEGDLRKVIFFRKNADGSYRFKGSYTQNKGLFSGIAVNEMLLVRAECNARIGLVTAALDDLNRLIQKRWSKNSVYVPYETSDRDKVLSFILGERRKELLMRGLRWMDVKRLNKEGAGIKFGRLLNGTVFELPANDLRFALPLPEDVIQMSNMEQNPR